MEGRILSFTITEEESGQMLREYLKGAVGLSAHQISRLKYRPRGICVGGEPSYVNRILQAGDILELSLPEVKEFRGTRGAKPGKIWAPPDPSLDAFPLSVLYEDEDLLIVDKPAGIVCHPSPGHYADTLANQAAQYLGGVNTQMDIRITGRLDQDTSGIVTIAKNQVVAGMIQRMREKRKIQKTYVALAEGTMESDRGVIDRPLRREYPGSHKMAVTSGDDAEGKCARTHWQVMERRIFGEQESATLLACSIEHGRMHQIRVHMASIGHPLVGDRLYGRPGSSDDGSPDGEKRKERRAAAEEHTMPMGLHAWKLSFRQPLTGEHIEIEAPLPDWARKRSGD